MKKWILPNKKIAKENIQYEWVAENEACEVCKSLDGNIYNSADDIPDRPHPNCKCHIEITEKAQKNGATDPIERRRKENEDRQRILLEIKELLGNIKSNKKEIEEFLDKITEVKKNFDDIQPIIDNDAFESKDKEKFNNALRDIESATFKAQKVKTDLDELENSTIVLEGKVEETNVMTYPLAIILNTLNVLKNSYRLISKITKEILEVMWKDIIRSNVHTNILIKGFANFIGQIHTEKHNMPEAFNLYKVGSQDYNFNKEYVDKNGYLYESISDLKNYKLEKDIHQRISKEMGLEDCKVLFLRNDSSIAHTIEKSNALKRFVKQNKNDLMNNKVIKDSEVVFDSDDSDMYAAVHGTRFKDAYIDNEGNLHIRVEDFWNFELRWTSAKAVLGRYLQDAGKLVPYYVVIDLKIGQDVWGTFL